MVTIFPQGIFSKKLSTWYKAYFDLDLEVTKQHLYFISAKQATNSSQIQGEEITDSLFLLLDGRNSGHSQGWEKSVVANFVESAIIAPVSELLEAT